MPFVFSPLSLGVLSKVRILLETLGAVDVGLLEVNGGSSVGTEGRFDVADGSGGWKQSKLFENALGTSLVGDYQTITFQSEPGGEIAMGGSGIADQPSFIRERTRGGWLLTVLNVTAMVVDSVTSASILSDRLLGWNGTQNQYFDPQAALFRFQSISGNTTLTADFVGKFWVTVGCEVGGLNVNVPAAGPAVNRRVTVKDMNGNAGASPITVNAGALWTINVNFGWVVLQSDGTNWRIVEQS